MMTDVTQRIRVEWWKGEDESLQPVIADLGVERDEDNSNYISVHTFVDDRGSMSSFVLDRESARRLALRLLQEAEV
jgi:hypothetical protein